MTQAMVDDSQLVEKLRAGHRNVIKELRKVIIAQDDVIDQVGGRLCHAPGTADGLPLCGSWQKALNWHQ